MSIPILPAWLLLAYLLLTAGASQAQTDSTWSKKPELEVGGFIDIFWAYDFNTPQGEFRQPFLYNHNRHNEFNLNLGLLRGAVRHAKYRAHLTLQAGTYANDNYAEEPQSLKNIFEANAGLSLNSKNTLWLDAGIFGSHIGFESAISLQNWTLTRSLLAENSPYFLSGAKLTYSPTNKLDLAILICNGWQRIQRLTDTSLPSFGTQLALRPSSALSLNWSTFIGTDDPDHSRRMRYFNNLYSIYQISSRLGLIGGIDVGIQQQAKGSKRYDLWASPVLITRYSLTDHWATALRAEYYQDKAGVIIPSQAVAGFSTAAFSLNVDYSPLQHLAWRLEGRWFRSRDRIFEREGSLVNSDFFIVTSLAIGFGD